MSSSKRYMLSWKELMGILAIVIIAAILAIPMAIRARSVNCTSCQNNMKQIGVIFAIYAKENKDFLPRLQGPDPWFVDATALNGLGDSCGADDRNDWAPNPSAIYPDYLNSWQVFACPGDVTRDLRIIKEACPYAGFASNPDASYTYLGYLIDRADAQSPIVHPTIKPVDIGYGSPEISVQLSLLS